MRKIILMAIFFQLLTCFCFAQQKGSGGNRIEATKIAFITKELDLTPDEAEKFWPVYNLLSKEVKEARIQYRDNELGFTEAVLNIGKKYQPEFKKILGSDERVNKVYTSERRFREMLRKELQNRQRRDGKRDTNSPQKQ